MVLSVFASSSRYFPGRGKCWKSQIQGSGHPGHCVSTPRLWTHLMGMFQWLRCKCFRGRCALHANVSMLEQGNTSTCSSGNRISLLPPLVISPMKSPNLFGEVNQTYPCNISSQAAQPTHPDQWWIYLKDNLQLYHMPIPIP